MALTILKQPNAYSWDPFTGAYNNMFIAASSTNATQIGFKYKIEIWINYYSIVTGQFETTTITLKQPPQPNGILSIDISEYLKGVLNETAIALISNSSTPHTPGSLVASTAKFKVTITEEVNGVLQGSPVETRNCIAYYGSSAELDTPYDTESFVWAINGEPWNGTNNYECPVPTSYTFNQGLITWQPDAIKKSQDPTMPFTPGDWMSITKVNMPRLYDVTIPMFVQQNSDLPLTSWVNQWVYPAFSVIHRYYNGTTLTATKAYTINGCGDNKVLSNTSNIQYSVGESIQSIGYTYKNLTEEQAATHVWITVHPYSDPDVCRGATNTPALDCNQMSSIIAYSEPTPFAGYRIDFQDTCTQLNELNDPGRSKWGQIIFLNKSGTWDTIFLKQVKTKYTVKKSTWRGDLPLEDPSTYGVENPRTKRVHVNQVDTTTEFTCKTDFMLDNTEEIMKQVYNSPAVYLKTVVARDIQYPYGSGGNYQTEMYRVQIDSATFNVKRRQTDNLFQYTIDCIADYKPRTQRT